MSRTPEGVVKHAIKSWLKTVPGCWFYMPVQSGMGVVGIPDIIGCLEGNFFAIEVKAPGKLHNVTPNQRAQLRGIEEAGGLQMAVDSLSSVRTCFIDAGLV